MIESDSIMRYIRIFSELSGQIKYAPQKRVLIEIALIKLCRPSMETGPDALSDRIAQLERQLERGVVVQSVAPTAGGKRTDAPQVSEKKEPVMPKAVSEDLRQAAKNWRSVIMELPGTTRSFLKMARLSPGEGNKLILVFDDDLAYTYVSEENRRRLIEDTISHRIGKEIELIIQENDSGRPFEETYVDLEKIVHMDIEIEE
jgi:DNA polymerase-3 subunit gamma/tau